MRALPEPRTSRRPHGAGALDGARFVRDPAFGLEVPTAVPDVPGNVLDDDNPLISRAMLDAFAADEAHVHEVGPERRQAAVAEEQRDATERATRQWTTVLTGGPGRTPATS